MAGLSRSCARSGRPGLNVSPQRGGRERRVAEFAGSTVKEWLNGPYLAWTPDSKWLALAEPISGTQKRVWPLFLRSAETGESRRLTNPPAAVFQGDTAP